MNKEQKKIKAWLRKKLKNLVDFMGEDSYACVSTGIKRCRTRLSDILMELDKKISEMK